MFILYAIIMSTFFLVILIAIKVRQVKIGKKRVQQELQKLQYDKMTPIGTVKSLSILPLIDFYSDKQELRTEPGVSYLIKADKTTVLMDVGYNPKSLHPSPLLQNMRVLGVSEKDIDMIFISHLHLDHLGGAKEQKFGLFSISQGPVEMPEIPVYAPGKVSPSKWNPEPKPEVILEPKKLCNGIASIGAIPRYLFLMGYTLENSLAINVEGKGIVLIIGCGHQTVERIIERAQSLFNEPIYGIIGGLHLPVNGGREIFGPFDIQHIVGSDNPPWNGLTEVTVKTTIKEIKKVNPQLVALSAHDSSDWSIEQFKEAFKDKYCDIEVGKEILV